MTEYLAQLVARIAFWFAALVASLTGADAAAQVPQAAIRWRHEVTTQARLVWGLSAPIATFAAQLHQESSWNAAARSHVGAAGMAQFMPKTSAWIAEVFAADLHPAEPYNPAWSIRALVRYDRWLWERVSATEPCNRMAMVLSAYNGGLGNLEREQYQAIGLRLDPNKWWGNVELARQRAQWAWDENRTYVIRILKYIEDRYEAGGWGVGSC